MEAIALEILRSGQIANGPAVQQFESEFERAVARPHAVSTSDMTGAITLALHLAGVGSGDEVATLAFSCLSSNSPIAKLGATPVWIDVEPITMAMSVEDLQRKLTPRTKAVMMYHVAGYPGPAAAVAELCRGRGITFIEDCNNAIGAEIKGQRVGQDGDYAVYSLYPNRQINGIDGGILVCGTGTDAARARALRRFGIHGSTFRDSRGEINPHSDVPEMGWSIALNQLNAAVAASQLPTLPVRLQRTQDVGRQLQAKIRSIAALTVVDTPDGRPAFWGCLLLAEHRDALLAHLKSNRIQASILHHRNDDYSGFGTARAQLPGTDRVMASLIAVPSGWWLSEDEVDGIVNCLAEFRMS